MRNGRLLFIPATLVIIVFLWHVWDIAPHNVRNIQTLRYLTAVQYDPSIWPDCEGETSVQMDVASAHAARSVGFAAWARGACDEAQQAWRVAWEASRRRGQLEAFWAGLAAVAAQGGEGDPVTLGMLSGAASAPYFARMHRAALAKQDVASAEHWLALQKAIEERMVAEPATSDWRQLRVLARAAYANGDWPRAVELYAELLQDSSGDLLLVSEAYHAAMQAESWTYAVEWATELVRRQPTEERLYLRLVAALFPLERFDEAASWLGEAEQRFPQSWQIQLQWARLECRIGNYAAASARLERALQLGGDSRQVNQTAQSCQADLP